MFGSLCLLSDYVPPLTFSQHSKDFFLPDHSLFVALWIENGCSSGSSSSYSGSGSGSRCRTKRRKEEIYYNNSSMVVVLVVVAFVLVFVVLWLCCICQRRCAINNLHTPISRLRSSQPPTSTSLASHPLPGPATAPHEKPQGGGGRKKIHENHLLHAACFSCQARKLCLYSISWRLPFSRL